MVSLRTLYDRISYTKVLCVPWYIFCLIIKGDGTYMDRTIEIRVESHTGPCDIRCYPNAYRGNILDLIPEDMREGFKFRLTHKLLTPYLVNVNPDTSEVVIEDDYTETWEIPNSMSAIMFPYKYKFVLDAGDKPKLGTMYFKLGGDKLNLSREYTADLLGPYLEVLEKNFFPTILEYAGFDT